MAFHFQHYQTYFCLPATLSSFTFGTFLFPDILHPTQWSLASPRWQGSNDLSSNSNPLDLGPTEKPDLPRALHELSSPLSPHSTSKAIASTWRISWPESKHLCSIRST